MMSFFLRSKPDEKAYQNKDKSADFGIILLFFVKTLKRHQLLRGGQVDLTSMAGNMPWGNVVGLSTVTLSGKRYSEFNNFRRKNYEAIYTSKRPLSRKRSN